MSAVMVSCNSEGGYHADSSASCSMQYRLVILYASRCEHNGARVLCREHRRT